MARATKQPHPGDVVLRKGPIGIIVGRVISTPSTGTWWNYVAGYASQEAALDHARTVTAGTTRLVWYLVDDETWRLIGPDAQRID